MRHYKNGQDLTTKILSGVNKLADNVGSTLGPRGRTVGIMYQGENIPMVTKDGVTVAQHITFEDPFENMGAQIVKQAAKQSASNAGDGTTTATVLTRGILNRAQKYIVAGASPTEIKRGMEHSLQPLLTQQVKTVLFLLRKQDRLIHLWILSKASGWTKAICLVSSLRTNDRTQQNTMTHSF